MAPKINQSDDKESITKGEDIKALPTETVNHSRVYFEGILLTNHSGSMSPSTSGKPAKSQTTPLIVNSAPPGTSYELCNCGHNQLGTTTGQSTTMADHPELISSKSVNDSPLSTEFYKGISGYLFPQDHTGCSPPCPTSGTLFHGMTSAQQGSSFVSCNAHGSPRSPGRVQTLTSPLDSTQCSACEEIQGALKRSPRLSSDYSAIYPGELEDAASPRSQISPRERLRELMCEDTGDHETRRVNKRVMFSEPLLSDVQEEPLIQFKMNNYEEETLIPPLKLDFLCEDDHEGCASPGRVQTLTSPLDSTQCSACEEIQGALKCSPRLSSDYSAIYPGELEDAASPRSQIRPMERLRELMCEDTGDHETRRVNKRVMFSEPLLSDVQEEPLIQFNMNNYEEETLIPPLKLDFLGEDDHEGCDVYTSAVVDKYDSVTCVERATNDENGGVETETTCECQNQNKQQSTSFDASTISEAWWPTEVSPVCCVHCTKSHNRVSFDSHLD